MCFAAFGVGLLLGALVTAGLAYWTFRGLR